MGIKYAFSALFLLVCGSVQAAGDEKRIIVGYVEKIGIPSVSLELKAKLDTGATTSSIHANIIKIAEKAPKAHPAIHENEVNEPHDLRSYVIFSVVNSEEETKHLKKELVRFARIKKKDGGLQRRPVVRMKFCLAGQLIEEEVNLADRDHYNYDVLIGRNMLTKGYLIVDAAKSFTTKPNCMVPVSKDAES